MGKKNKEFAKLVESVVMIPGSCAYLYDTEVLYGNYGEPLNSLDGKESDVKRRIDKLKSEFPNLKNVSIVVGWYFDTTDAAQLTIAPRIDSNESIKDDTWCVGNITREQAQCSLDKQATPSDISILHVVMYLKEAGYNVTLYPMLFGDDEDKTWRGFIKGKSKDDIDHFFVEYKKFILHYANLSIDSVPLKCLLSQFIVGSEMKDLLKYYDEGSQEYYAVQKMAELAREVKSILGEDVKTVYAANWSDYGMNSKGCYHHDELYEAVDIVGIDLYTPITDGIPQSEITKEVIKEHWEKGVYWDYKIKNGNHVPISPERAIKNFEYWYTHPHINKDGSKTSWKPGEKVVIATEFGYPKVDKCTEKPYDFSIREDVNKEAQTIALEAGLEYLQGQRESKPELKNLFPDVYVYAIDARGDFYNHPELYDDWQSYFSGHWQD